METALHSTIRTQTSRPFCAQQSHCPSAHLLMQCCASQSLRSLLSALIFTRRATKSHGSMTPRHQFETRHRVQSSDLGTPQKTANQGRLKVSPGDQRPSCKLASQHPLRVLNHSKLSSLRLIRFRAIKRGVKASTCSSSQKTCTPPHFFTG